MPLRGERAQPGQQTARKPKDDLVKRAILRMKQNVGTPFSVAALARQMAVGLRRLERRFPGELVQSPAQVYQYIWGDRTLARLRTTRDTVAEIGLATGFCDGTHLARVLKTERGFSPAEYRKAQAARDADMPAVGVLLNR
jgi:transcriptional regulator GlxA family with amidase domain